MHFSLTANIAFLKETSVTKNISFEFMKFSGGGGTYAKGGGALTHVSSTVHC